MYVVPQTRVGTWSLRLLLVVVLFPLYWSVFMLIPDSWHGLSVGIAVLIPILALTSLVLTGVAIFRKKDRSLLLIVFGVMVLLVVLGFGIGELLLPH